MTAVAAPTLLDSAIAEHHDYVWARLPFIVPMAVAVARRRGDRIAHALAGMMVELRPLVLGHLEREEQQLAGHPVTPTIHDRLHADHVAVTTLLDRIRNATGNAEHDRDCTDPTERVLYSELARLDEHLAAQITLEEHLMACR
jgi:iron-sulfur cluster repair protein YtfE (RIC family)